MAPNRQAHASVHAGNSPHEKAGPETQQPLTDRWTEPLARLSTGKTVVTCDDGDVIFMQGEPADAVFFLSRGTIRLSVATYDGKEAIVATLAPGDVFGEGCLAGQTVRMTTAIAAGPCTLTRVRQPTMTRLLHDDAAVADMFVSHLLPRIIRYEADLMDQLFNSSERRLARVLLLLSRYGEDGRTEAVVAGVNQEQLAQMVGTTRSRVNCFMNRFRKRGFIDYHGVDGVIVRGGLLTVLRQSEAETVGRLSKHPEY